MTETSRHDRTPTDELRRLLRRGDPAADRRAPDAAEVATLRQRILEEHRTASAGSSDALRRGPRSWLLRPALAAALVVMALGGGTLWWMEGGPRAGSVPEPQPASTTAQDTPRAMTAEAALRTRQIYFETPGGNRIVWLLTVDEPSVGPTGPGGVP